MSSPGYPTIDFDGKPVLRVRPIKASEFNSMEEFKDCVEQQGLKYIIVTKNAWNKYELLVFGTDDHE